MLLFTGNISIYFFALFLSLSLHSSRAGKHGENVKIWVQSFAFEVATFSYNCNPHPEIIQKSSRKRARKSEKNVKLINEMYKNIKSCWSSSSLRAEEQERVYVLSDLLNATFYGLSIIFTFESFGKAREI